MLSQCNAHASMHRVDAGSRAGLAPRTRWKNKGTWREVGAGNPSTESGRADSKSSRMLAKRRVNRLQIGATPSASRASHQAPRGRCLSSANPSGLPVPFSARWNEGANPGEIPRSLSQSHTPPASPGTARQELSLFLQSIDTC
jgi:hypothetical protein